MSKIHAALGASSSNIWMNCPEAGRNMRHAPRQPTSFAAAEGTVAHDIAEQALIFGLQQVWPLVGSVIECEGQEITVTDEMIEAAGEYCSFVDLMTSPGDTRLTEQMVSLNAAVYGTGPVLEPLFGTTDAVIISEDGTTVTVLDFKYGSMPVDVSSLQLLYYGAAVVYTLAPKAKKLNVGIVQPRADHKDGKTRILAYTRKEVDQFINDVANTVQDITSGAGGYNPGTWCHWCPLSGSCPALAERNLAVVGDVKTLKSPAVLTPETLAKVLSHAAPIRRWLDAVEEEGIRRLEKDEPVPGFRLVPKRAMRKWFDKDSRAVYARIAQVLTGEKAAQLLDYNVLSPTKAESVLSKDEYQRLVDQGLIAAVSSGMTIAAEKGSK
jgi:hypothetical protein